MSTLWPEIEKVFGHGYEVYQPVYFRSIAFFLIVFFQLHAIASSSSGKYVATACRATSPEHAGIKVYDSETWKPFGQTLFGHQLTVTRIAFSPDDKYILSVSRDRSWRLFEHMEGEKCDISSKYYVVVTKTMVVEGFIPFTTDKTHARIIWDCAWSLQGDIFATASRDKTVGSFILIKKRL